MKILLRKSKKLELKEISKIYMAEFSKPPYNEKWTRSKSFERISFYFKYYDLYSILADRKLVGFICVNPKFMCPGEVAYGDEIAIMENYQGKGIGTQVVRQIYDIYKKKGFKRFLSLVNKRGNSMKMLKKLGAKESKLDILMEKRLN